VSFLHRTRFSTSHLPRATGCYRAIRDTGPTLNTRDDLNAWLRLVRFVGSGSKHGVDITLFFRPLPLFGNTHALPIEILSTTFIAYLRLARDQHRATKWPTTHEIRHCACIALP
jgi:hypothetical protein